MRIELFSVQISNDHLLTLSVTVLILLSYHLLFLIHYFIFVKEICARQCQDDITIHTSEGEAYANDCDESESLLETTPV